MRIAYWRHSGCTAQVAQIALARLSRAIFSSLRSARVGGKNTAACGPLQAALVCHSSPIDVVANLTLPQVTLSGHSKAGQGV